MEGAERTVKSHTVFLLSVSGLSLYFLTMLVVFVFHLMFLIVVVILVLNLMLMIIPILVFIVTCSFCYRYCYSCA